MRIIALAAITLALLAGCKPVTALPDPGITVQTGQQ